MMVEGVEVLDLDVLSFLLTVQLSLLPTLSIHWLSAETDIIIIIIIIM